MLQSCIRQIKLLIASLFCLLAFGVHAVYAAKDSHGGGHEESAAGLPQLDVSTFPGQVFWLVITFVFLYTVFSKKTLPEISSVLENRKAHIEGDLNMAEEMKAKAESVQSAYEENLGNARIKASEEMATIHNEMKTSAEEIYQEFRLRSEKEIKETETHLMEARQDAMEDMNVIVAEIAREAAQKIVGITTDIEQAKTVVKAINHNDKARAA